MAGAGLKAEKIKNYSITTLGCKVNHCESESITQLLKESEWISVPLGEDAKFCIMNAPAASGRGHSLGIILGNVPN
ncbi:MAG: hypothetical protein FP811_08140 [Desulfobacteraceae bacterium]|nr:hypothetical protein [Desulfobacteraceae bacterium]